MNGEQKAVDGLTKVIGIVELVVYRIAEDGEGRTEERVKVRALAVKHYPKIVSALGDQLALAALYCGKVLADGHPADGHPADGNQAGQPDVEWAGDLAPESLKAIMEEGNRLNLDFFSQWFDRQKGMVEILRPGLAEKLMAKAAEKAES